MDKLFFRFADTADAAALLDIYKPYINTAITFETEIPKLSEFKKRIADISKFYPYIVCEVNGEIVGYAYAHRQKERDAYRFNAELSIYIKNEKSSCGIGRAIFEKLIEILCLMNVQNLYSYITYPNIKSEKLHEAFGFTKTSVLKNTGYKNGRWYDVCVYEKSIGNHEMPPRPLLSVNDISEKAKNEILKIKL